MKHQDVQPRSPLPTPEILDARLHRVTLPLVAPFVTTHGVLHQRDVLLVELVGAEGVGWGECAALPAPTYTGEWVDGAEAVLRRHLLPAVLAGHTSAGVAGNPMASAAVDAALLDLALGPAGCSLADWVGGERDRVACAVAVGLERSIDALLAEVARHVGAGYHRVKLKVGPSSGLDPVRAVRQAWPTLAVAIDANGSLDPSTMSDWDDLGLVEIEQPLPPDDLVGLTEVSRRLQTPVCLDESVGSVDHLRSALALGWRGHVNLKPGRVGGIHAALAIYDLAVAEGIPLWIGGMLSTGIGKAVDVALASLAGVALPSEIYPSSRWFDTDVTEPWGMATDGTMAVRPAGPVHLPTEEDS